MNPEPTLLVTYLRARITMARRDESGIGAVEWAIIVALAVAIAIAVAEILRRKATGTARDMPTE